MMLAPGSAFEMRIVNPQSSDELIEIAFGSSVALEPKIFSNFSKGFTMRNGLFQYLWCVFHTLKGIPFCFHISTVEKTADNRPIVVQFHLKAPSSFSSAAEQQAYTLPSCRLRRDPSSNLGTRFIDGWQSG